jgi:hypothetical protein
MKRIVQLAVVSFTLAWFAGGALAQSAQRLKARVANDPALTVLRERCVIKPVTGMRGDSAEIVVHLRDGRVLTGPIEHFKGSIAAPLSDFQLDQKLISQVAPVIGEPASDVALHACRNVLELDDAIHLVEALRSDERKHPIAHQKDQPAIL